jgi:hypothetical protein
LLAECRDADDDRDEQQSGHGDPVAGDQTGMIVRASENSPQ